MRAWALAVIGYVGLALAVTWPLAAHLGDQVLGFAQVDQMDTAWLRLATARLLAAPGTWPWSTELHAPAGYPLGWLVPNVLDHATAAPLVLALPWPVADNLWWIACLAANGLAAHALGRQEGGSHAAGAVAGTLFAVSEPVLREANLHHAPQAMVFAAPVYLAALLRLLREDGARRDAIAAGVWIAVAGLTYWYLAMFLAFVSVPLAIVHHAAWRRGAAAAAVAIGIVAVPIALLLGARDALPNNAESPPADPGTSALVADFEPYDRWVFSQGSDPLWPVRSTPMDRSNRLGVVLVVGAILGASAAPRRTRGALVAGALVGGVAICGHWLKIGEDPVLVGGHPIPLPSAGFAAVSGVFDRLTWPQRWGIVVPLLLLPLAARAPRPWWLVALAVVEPFVLSANAPLATTPVAQFDGWRSLQGARAVLVLPLDRTGPRAPSLGFIYRAVGRPLATPFDVPPGATPPAAWEDWRRQSQLAEWLATGDGAVPPEAIAQLRAEGIDVIAIDTTPGGAVPDSKAYLLALRLKNGLGEPVDYGACLAWWLDGRVPPPGLADGPRWRERTKKKLEAWSPPTSRSVMRPVRWIEKAPR
jgi:hypothetical protein